MRFNLTTPQGLNEFEAFISTRTYVAGFFLSSADVEVASQLCKPPSAAQFPHTRRHYFTVRALNAHQRQALPVVNLDEAGAKAEAKAEASGAGGKGMDAQALDAAVKAQGDMIRQLKKDGIDKASLQPHVDKLLALKRELEAAAKGEGEPQKKQKVESKPEQPKGKPAEDDEGKSKNQLKKEAKMKKLADKKGNKDAKDKAFAVTEVQPSTSNNAKFKPSPSLTSVGILREWFALARDKAFPEAKAAGVDEIRILRRGITFQINTPLEIMAKRSEIANVPGKPTDIGRKLIACLPKCDGLVETVGITNNGFVMVSMSVDHFLKNGVEELMTRGVVPPKLKQKTVAVDFSSPNIAKEMHVGHLRSTIIGDTVCRMFEHLGHKVLRINHVGDWGTQFGMLLCHLEDKVPKFLDDPAQREVDLTKFYKEAKRRFDEEDGFKKRAQEKVVTLQSGDPKARAMWQALCDISRADFAKLYTRLDVRLEETGESFYNPLIPAVLEDLKQKKLLEESDGAQCVFVDRSLPPLMVQKSDGGFGYDSTDIAAIRYRANELKADVLVYITDVGQAEHFKLVFGAAQMAGYLRADQEAHHIGFGLVQDDSGHRFRTRSGEVVSLVSLLDEAVARMTATLNARIEENKCPLTKGAEVERAANVIGHASVKYFDLRQNPASNYKFSYDKMLDDRGDTAVYLLYTRARINSILTKAKEERGVDVQDLLKNPSAHFQFTHDTEIGLGFELLQLEDVIASTLKDLQPNQLCKYLYDVCALYSKWNNACKVLGSPEMKARLLLCLATMRVMDKCFELLGIQPLDRV